MFEGKPSPWGACCQSCQWSCSISNAIVINIPISGNLGLESRPNWVMRMRAVIVIRRALIHVCCLGRSKITVSLFEVVCRYASQTLRELKMMKDSSRGGHAQIYSHLAWVCHLYPHDIVGGESECRDVESGVTGWAILQDLPPGHRLQVTG